MPSRPYIPVPYNPWDEAKKVKKEDKDKNEKTIY